VLASDGGRRRSALAPGEVWRGAGDRQRLLLRHRAARDIQLEDLEKIELAMRRLKNKRVPFERMELATDEAIAVMEKLGQRYKVELLGLLKEKGSTAVAKDTGDDAVGRGCGRCPDRLTLQERRFCRSCGAAPRAACGRDQPFQADPTRSWQHGLSRGPRAISQVRSPTCRTW
jgi:hypothetical protein